MTTAEEALNAWFEDSENKGKIETLIWAFLKEKREVFTDDEELNKATARVILAVAVQLCRSRQAHHLPTSTVRGVRAAFNSLGEVLDKLNVRPSWHTPLSLTLAGYDPTVDFSKNDIDKDGYIKSNKLDNWSKIFGGEEDKRILKLTPTYEDAKKKIYLDFHDLSTRFDLLLVDFAWLPDLAYQGHILPIDLYLPNIKQDIKEKVKNSTIDGNQADAWERLLEYLASAGNNHMYVLPISLNFHGKARGKGSNIVVEDSFEQQLNLKKAIVQGKRDSSLVYQLFAHFAYRGHVPIVLGPEPFMVKLSFKSQNSYSALGDMLARLKFAKQGYVKDPFLVNHNDEADAVKTPSCWSPCFGYELYSKLSKSPQAPIFSQPYRSIDLKRGHRYLSSIGGYGLAISRQAGEPHSAASAAQALFMKGEVLKLKDYKEYLELPQPDYLTDFIELHTRPRIPFWAQAEQIIGCHLKKLFDTCKEAVEGNNETDMKIKFSSHVDNSKQILEDLEGELKMMFESNGWKVLVIEADED